MAMCTENYDACFPDQPVVDRYLPVLAHLPELAAKPAFIWADDDAASTRTALTYAELDAAVGLMARNLLAPGKGRLRRGDAVLVLASPGLRLVTLLFACQRAGLTAVPVMVPAADDGPAHAHLLRAVSQARPKAAVADDARYIDSVASNSKAGMRWLAVDELEEMDGDGPVPTEEEPEPYVGCGPDDVYLIQYTAGTTTGAPMPVVITAGSAAHNARAARKAYGLHPGSVVASWLPQYHDCGLMFLLTTVVAGATCVLTAPSAFARRPRLWLELVSEFGATCTPVPPFALPLVLRRGRQSGHPGRPLELGSLRSLILMSDPIYESCVDEFVAAFSCHGLRAACVSPSYGLAENCSFVSTVSPSYGLAENSSGSGSDRRLPSYMKLLPSARLSNENEEAREMEIVVVDEETGEPVADGVEGEIWVASPSNAAGYLGHPSATREVLCARVPGRAGPCFVRTGDRGVVRGAERYLYVLGRSADVIALRHGDDGGRVHAHYVETAAFSSAPDRLRGGCVAAFAMSPCGVAVVAELQRAGGGEHSRRHSHSHRVLCDGVRAAVWREEGVSVGLVVLVGGGVVPKTTSGKLRRGVARKMLADGKLRVLFQARYEDDGDGSVADGRVRDQGGRETMGRPVPGESGQKAGTSRGLRFKSYL